MVPSFTYIGNAIIGERSDQNTFSKLTPFSVPKNVTSFSVCLRNVVSNLTPFLVTEIGTSCSARTQMWANGSLAKAYRLESLGDCHGDCGMVSMRVQAHIKLPLQQCVSGGLVWGSTFSRIERVASHAWLDVLPAGVESCAAYACFVNILLRIYSCGSCFPRAVLGALFRHVVNISRS